jgi:hypothetical protein
LVLLEKASVQAKAPVSALAFEPVRASAQESALPLSVLLLLFRRFGFDKEQSAT